MALGLEMLATKPLPQVGIDAIAAAAGISRGLLFHYFPSKRDFHVAVVRAAADELLARTAPDPALPLLGRLRAGLEAFIDYVGENPDAYVALVRGAAGSDEDLHAVFDDTRAAICRRVHDALGLGDRAARGGCPRRPGLGGVLRGGRRDVVERRRTRPCRVMAW